MVKLQDEMPPTGGRATPETDRRSPKRRKAAVGAADDADARSTLVPSSFGDAEGRAILVLSRESFYTLFKRAHAICGRMTGLVAFRISAEGEQGRDVSDAIYDMALECRSLLWLIQPYPGGWLDLAPILALYADALRKGIAVEIATRGASEPTDPPGGPAGP